MTFKIMDAENEFACLMLEVEEGKERQPRHYVFSVSHFLVAMNIHNFICAKNDGREPTLYLVSDQGREVLNNRMEFTRAMNDARAQRANPGLVMPGIFSPDF